MRRDRRIDRLLQSPDLSIRWRMRVRVMGETREEPRVKRLEEGIRRSPRVRALLSHSRAAYRPGTVRSVYYKWQGLHWVLAQLTDLGYPRGDPMLGPLIDRALALWLRPSFLRTYVAATRKEVGRHPGVAILRGRARRCASQQGNALRYLTALGWPDDRCQSLSALLRGWQWPDGGWNCDPDPNADTSSFMETLLPMRGLAAYGSASADSDAQQAARAAARIFLERGLFRRRSDGAVMHPEFLRLHFPLYWHYDVLGGLNGIAEVGRLKDPRCGEALDWLESRELPDGGWPADARYYRVSDSFQSSSEFVGWGSTRRDVANEWVTADALYVLHESGRLTL
jgi:hypothetical protein